MFALKQEELTTVDLTKQNVIARDPESPYPYFFFNNVKGKKYIVDKIKFYNKDGVVFSVAPSYTPQSYIRKNRFYGLIFDTDIKVKRKLVLDTDAVFVTTKIDYFKDHKVDVYVPITELKGYFTVVQSRNVAINSYKDTVVKYQIKFRNGEVADNEVVVDTESVWREEKSKEIASEILNGIKAEISETHSENEFRELLKKYNLHL